MLILRLKGMEYVIQYRMPFIFTCTSIMARLFIALHNFITITKNQPTIFTNCLEKIQVQNSRLIQMFCAAPSPSLFHLNYSNIDLIEAKRR